MNATMLKEYCGYLIGGPNADEFVEATVPRIVVTNTSLLWLDGVSANTNASSKRILGTYIWDDEKRHFKWNMEGIGFNSRGT